MDDRVVYLRVDVDFNVGLERGVPWLLDLFDRYGAEATFLMVMGPDTLHRHSRRVTERSFRQRLLRLSFWKILWHMGPAYLRSRWLRQRVAGAFPEIVREIAERGHQLGLHGHDHAAWADGCYEFSRADTRTEMERAYEACQQLLGEGPVTWGAPNWRCNDYMFRILEEWGVAYSSDTRGSRPFYPQVGDGSSSAVLQLPISLPCMHELVQLGCRRSEIPAIVERCLENEYNLLCIHDYYEGLLERRLFEATLAHLSKRGWQFRSLHEAFNVWHDRAVEPGVIDRVEVPGGARPVSCERGFLHRNYFEHVCRAVR